MKEKANTKRRPGALTPEAPAPTLMTTLTTGLHPKVETSLAPPAVVEVPGKPPIISLTIPLLDPKNPRPGQALVVVNVLKLAEDKYGWSAMHPDAKTAIDIMDDAIDDDDDAADEEDDEKPDKEEKKDEKRDEKKDDKKEDKPKEKELTEEQLIRQHEIMMARKVGKYDYEDPFIDDEELQWEEEITSTKEGFFVYWGPLVEDRNQPSGKSKKKK